MTKVITYGTYDMLHYGHINLLKNAKALGDYLIVGITSDDFDKTRGKINVQQTLIERIEAVKALGLADEIVVEEYEGQKIDDIKRYDVDIFTVGSDWVGHFDYLNEYCKVVYLPRTKGISSSELREKKRAICLGVVGDSLFLKKIVTEGKYVNGLNISAIFTSNPILVEESKKWDVYIAKDYNDLLDHVDAIYLKSRPEAQYDNVKKAILRGKHVLCESPIAIRKCDLEEIMDVANKKNVILMEAIKTAYSTAYRRLLLLLKEGRIGDILSVEATCTSLVNNNDSSEWDCLYEWGPTALLPVFDVLGTNYLNKNTYVLFSDKDEKKSGFIKTDYYYENAVASIKVGNEVKSEGELIVSGTNGYLYVPAPWWKTDYFEMRYEDASENRRYFYQLDGEGIRYELVAFTKAVNDDKDLSNISCETTKAICEYIEDFNNKIQIKLLDRR